MGQSPFSDPRLAKAFRDLEEAVSLQRQGQFDAADKVFSRIIKKNPDYFDALHFYGLFKYQQRQFADALKLVAKATKINPRSPNSFNSLGVILAHLGRHTEALTSFDSALKLEPHHLQALNNRGNSLNELGRYDDAINNSNRVLAVNPNLSEAYIPRGAALFRCRRYTEALESYDLALKLNPNAAVAWIGRGNVFFDLKRYDEALAAYDSALVLKSDSEQAWLGRGNVYLDLKRYDDAVAAFDRALALKPDIGTQALRLNATMFICDWDDFNTERDYIIAAIKNKKANANPFFFLSISTSSEDQLQCARSWVASRIPASQKPISQGDVYKHDKIRVAYVSADFHQHATSALLAGVFEGHDASRFEVTAISIGADDQSEMRARIKGSFDYFIDALPLGDHEIAQLIREKEIDILIDLKGFTQNARTGVFARRPAPVQVNYLGYPGTMGANYIDYLISDRTLILDSQQQYYTEKIVYLPDTYQGNDEKRLILDKTATRAALGLPDDGFVFCCFNNNYKIVPELFDSWMHILKQVDKSVLWLLEGNATATSNLKKEASNRGVEPSRIIFAPFMPPSDHLARHRCADLFLDTLPYNAHTTASDALWAGLPVLTQAGSTFAGRVAASLLNAVALPELITSTKQQYQERAVEIAKAPEQLVTLKQKLARNRLTQPLFNTQSFTRHIERAYEAMYERYQSRLPPGNIDVPR